MKNTYVDDILKSVNSTERARSLIQEFEEILRDCGFFIKNWVISGEDNKPMSSKMRIVDTTTGNVLGMVWNPKEDTFSFNTDSLPQPNDKEDVTSQEALSVTSRVFDPAGLLAPLTLGGKILMRNLSKDAKNDADLAEEFLEYDTAKHDQSGIFYLYQRTVPD